MTEADVPAAAEADYAAFSALEGQLGLPETPPDNQRAEQRFAYLLASDPDGCWVAEESGRVTGLAQAFIRDRLWVLSLLAVLPGAQGRGLGRELLQRVLAYGAPGGPGMIQSSSDPKAIALYAAAGFNLHPSVAARGPLRAPVDRPGGVRLADVTELDVAAATRTDILGLLLTQGGLRFLIDGDRGYAICAANRVVTMAALDEESASRILGAAMAEVGAGAPFQMKWITANQQWAIRGLVNAGIALHPYGPIMLRGMAAPPAPSIPSGGLG